MTVTMYKAFDPDRLYGGWFWGLRRVWNDWYHVYSDPYQVELPDGFHTGETVTGELAVFADDYDYAYVLESSSNKECCVPVLIGGSPVQYIRLKVVRAGDK